MSISVIIKRILCLFFCLYVAKSNASVLKLATEKAINVEEQDNLVHYVTAKSGLNYRKEAKGKILGKFLLNTEVKIVERTGVFEEIKDQGHHLQGEWVGVTSKVSIEKVYVFSAFLSVEKYETPFNIYDVQTYREKKKDEYFIILSDGYNWEEIEDMNLNEKVSNKHRELLLYNIGIKETDKVFIYSYILNKIMIFKVNELSLIAKEDPYAGYDYIAFDLKNKIQKGDIDEYTSSYVYIGKDNPFKKGEMKPIIWKKIENKMFPSVQIKGNDFNQPYVFKESDTLEYYSFINKNYKYYLKIKNKKHMYSQAFHLVVKLKGQVVFNEFYHSSEGATPAPLAFKTKKNKQHYEQWTGKIFKNKPPVILGFMYYSFSCLGIDFLDESEKSMRVKCDARH